MTTLLKNTTLCIEKVLFDTPGKITLKLEDGRIIIVPLSISLNFINYLLKSGKNAQLLTIEPFFSLILIQYITWKTLWD